VTIEGSGPSGDNGEKDNEEAEKERMIAREVCLKTKNFPKRISPGGRGGGEKKGKGKRPPHTSL